MYAQDYLVRERHQERLRQAENVRPGYRIAELRKLEKRHERAERQLRQAWHQLVNTWEHVEQLRSRLSEG
jgi:hypothetical protein